MLRKLTFWRRAPIVWQVERDGQVSAGLVTIYSYAREVHKGVIRTVNSVTLRMASAALRLGLAKDPCIAAATVAADLMVRGEKRTMSMTYK